MVLHHSIIPRISGFLHGTAAGISIRSTGADHFIGVTGAGTALTGTDTMPAFMQECTIRLDTDTGAGITITTTATTAAITIMARVVQQAVPLTVLKPDDIQAAQPKAEKVLPIALKPVQP